MSRTSLDGALGARKAQLIELSVGSKHLRNRLHLRSSTMKAPYAATAMNGDGPTVGIGRIVVKAY
jgi:hypothetical protein